MTPALRKLLLGLGCVTIVMVLVLVKQIRDAESIVINAEQLPLISPVAVELPTAKDEPLLGNPGAPLTVTAFLNFSDKKSREYYHVVSNLVKKHPTKIRLYVKHYPEEAFFSNPLLAHQAAICANNQGKFWSYVDAILKDGKSLRHNFLTEVAEKQGISLKTWEACLNEQSTLETIQADVYVAKSYGLPDAPILFLNNKLLNPEEEVELEQLLTSFITP